MRVIVFDRELHEPLTVVDVPHWLAEQAKTGQRIQLLPRLPVMPVTASEEQIEMLTYQAVTLTFERVARGRGGPETLFWFAYADDPETALLLRAAFLPGQLGEVQARERRAYVMGLFS